MYLPSSLRSNAPIYYCLLLQHRRGTRTFIEILFFNLNTSPHQMDDVTIILYKNVLHIYYCAVILSCMNVTYDIHVSVGQYMLDQLLLLYVALTHFQKSITVLLLIACPLFYIINIVHAVVADKHSSCRLGHY